MNVYRPRFGPRDRLWLKGSTPGARGLASDGPETYDLVKDRLEFRFQTEETNKQAGIPVYTTQLQQFDNALRTLAPSYDVLGFVFWWGP